MPTPSSSPHGSSDASDALLSPLAKKDAGLLRAGGSIPPAQRVNWSPNLALLIHEGVSAWLRTGDPSHLIVLLKKYPEAVAHPAVATSLRRMRLLMGKLEVAELTEEAELDGEFFSPKTCRAAHETLLSVASALVSAVVGDGWQLKPRPQKRGRPKRTIEDVGYAYFVLSQYERVLAFLQKSEVRRTKRESENQWRNRLKEIVRHAWAETIGVVETGSEPPGPGEGLLDSKIIYLALELPEKTLERCLRKAVEAAGDGLPMRDVIAYHLVGQRWSLKPSSVKHWVEVARDLDK